MCSTSRPPSRAGQPAPRPARRRPGAPAGDGASRWLTGIGRSGAGELCAQRRSSSRTKRTVEHVGKALMPWLGEAPGQQAAKTGGRLAGSRDRVGLFAQHWRRVFRPKSCRETRARRRAARTTRSPAPIRRCAVHALIAAARTHVGRGAHDDAGAGFWRAEPDRATGAGGHLGHLRQPEVEHFHQSSRRDDDVRRLEVAVDDAFLARGFERQGQLANDATGLGDRQLVRWRRAPPVSRPAPAP